MVSQSFVCLLSHYVTLCSGYDHPREIRQALQHSKVTHRVWITKIQKSLKYNKCLFDFLLEFDIIWLKISVCSLTCAYAATNTTFMLYTNECDGMQCKVLK